MGLGLGRKSAEKRPGRDGCSNFKQSSAKNSRDGWVKRPTHRRGPAYQQRDILARLRLRNSKSTRKALEKHSFSILASRATTGPPRASTSTSNNPHPIPLFRVESLISKVRRRASRPPKENPSYLIFQDLRPTTNDVSDIFWKPRGLGPSILPADPIWPLGLF